MVNIGNMMKQAQELQKKMSEAQEKLNSIEVEGVSGGGMVKVTATAKGEIKRIFLDESLLKPEDKEMTEDLIVAAINDAKQKAEKALVPLKQKIVGVKSVVIHDNLIPYYESPMRASFDGFAESMKSAPILSGDEEIRTNVSVVFYISQIE